MTEEEFWDVVGLNGSGDWETEIALIADRLRALPQPSDIAYFWVAMREAMNRAHTEPMWAAAYIMCGAGSEEGFDAFKAWIILHGRDYFEAALVDPDCLADIPEIEHPVCEQFLSLPELVYEERTGRPASYTVPPRPSLAFADRWDFDFIEGVRESLPRLWARYGEEPEAAF